VDGTLDRAAVSLGRGGGTSEVNGPGDIRLRVQPVPGPEGYAPAGSVVVGTSVSSLEQLEQQVLIGSVVVALLILVAGGFAIHTALDGALRPVAQMTATARDWGAHDLERRFELGPVRDELTALAATLDELLARIAASRRHEQRFASEMAHELRTPLAALRGRAELALASGGPEDQAAALRVVVAQASRLQHTIEALLAIARQELDPAQGTVDLASLARELPGVEVIAPPGKLPLGEGDPDVVRRALAPLVDNARRHARTRVWVELDAHHGHVLLRIRDDGPGVAPDALETVFAPGVRGSGNGAGLGLALARRLARSCGGDVTAEAGPGGTFVLRLPILAESAE
jgi:signal transduction histidine kinase